METTKSKKEAIDDGTIKKYYELKDALEKQINGLDFSKKYFDKFFGEYDFEGKDTGYSSEAMIPAVSDTFMNVDGKMSKNTSAYEKNLNEYLGGTLGKEMMQIKKQNETLSTITQVQFEALMDLAKFFIANVDVLNKEVRADDSEFLTALAFGDKLLLKKGLSSSNDFTTEFLKPKDGENAKEKITIKAYLPPELIIYIRKIFKMKMSEKEVEDFLEERFYKLEINNVVPKALKEAINDSKRSYKTIDNTEFQRKHDKSLVKGEFRSDKALYTSQSTVYIKRTGTIQQPKTDIIIPCYQAGSTEVFWVGELRVSLKKKEHVGIEGGNFQRKIQAMFEGCGKHLNSIVDKIVGDANVQGKNLMVRYIKNFSQEQKKRLESDKLTLGAFFNEIFKEENYDIEIAKYAAYRFLVGSVNSYVPGYGQKKKDFVRLIDAEANAFLVLDSDGSTKDINKILSNMIYVTSTSLTPSHFKKGMPATMSETNGIFDKILKDYAIMPSIQVGGYTLMDGNIDSKGIRNAITSRIPAMTFEKFSGNKYGIITMSGEKKSFNIKTVTVITGLEVKKSGKKNILNISVTGNSKISNSNAIFFNDDNISSAIKSRKKHENITVNNNPISKDDFQKIKKMMTYYDTNKPNSTTIKVNKGNTNIGTFYLKKENEEYSLYKKNGWHFWINVV